MYQTYQDIARFKLPCAIRAIDRFHIFQDFERRIQRVRSRLLQGHHRTSDEYYLLKHQNHLLDIRPDATNRKTGIPLLDQNAPKNYSKHFRRKMNSRELLEKLLAVSPDLEEVYLLKNELNDFFRKNSGLNVKDRTRRENLDRLIEEFASSPVGEMNEFAALLIRWENEILNSFIPFRMEYVTNRSEKSFWKTRRLNSSLVENKNRVIQTLKRNANGFTNWKRFRNRVLYVLDPSVTFSIPSNPKEERNRNSEHSDDESQNDLKK